MNTPIISVDNLSINLSGNTILATVSLSVCKGEYISIIGPNGAGKTTLIKCLAGIYREWSGSAMAATQRVPRPVLSVPARLAI